MPTSCDRSGRCGTGRTCAAMGLWLGLVTVSVLRAGEVAASVSRQTAEVTSRVQADYGRLPLAFERNEGQVAGPARYLSRGHGYTVFVAPTEMVLSLRTQSLRGTDPNDRASVRTSLLRVKLVKSARHT
jgi:hypothetical protein